ncbi:single-stranded-DNA-specific exonuclease RecJ [Scopulibacillus cellulosilyticus]|uniref:Single-stranded-DNA-specific exonuclease RecJ n=1 Tax=Scopulibacillus cellulosilyticus TaxID=2665665 RepID=A0ABW2PX16_9BACL
MLKPTTRWHVKTVDEQQAIQLAESLNVSPFIGKLLLGRGIAETAQAETFINKDEQAFYDPFLMDGMKEAVDRIHKAINDHESILVFGDYDADGVSSTSLLVRALRELGADASFYVPNRFTEGYGPNIPALEKAKEQGIGLVITVDTGIAAVEAARRAKELELDYIVTDHHEPPPELPEAYCIINPKKPGCPYPFKSLAGAGVAYKLAHALTGEQPSDLLALAAIGTISDLVPLVDENRLIASKGLDIINQGSFIGIEALLSVSSIERPVDSEHIGFGIGPRLNAAGRMDHAGPAVDLMLTNDPASANQLALDLDNLNQERKSVVDQMTRQALKQAEKQYDKGQKFFVIAGENWHEGVIGIVASRVVEKFYRPTIVFSINPETGLAKGSARSIEGFDIFQALSGSRDILPHFGGHPMAAGMTVASENLYLLSSRLNKYSDVMLTEDILTPLTTVDCECNVQDITIDVIQELNILAPFGVENPKPKFAIKNAHISGLRKIGKNQNHLKLAFTDNESSLDGIGFYLGDKYDQMTPDVQVSAVGQLSVNEWNGFRKPQMLVEDIKVDEWQLFDLRNEQKIQERLTKIPKEKRLMIAFHKQTIEQLELNQLEDEIYSFDDIDSEALKREYLVLLDLPNDRQQLKSLLQKRDFPERIYVIFHHTEEHFFSEFPARDHFKWLYAFILKQGSLNFSKMASSIARYKGWQKETVYFMAKVFFDLGFVKIDNGVMTVNPAPEKKPLTESRIYQQRREQMELEDIFCYSSYQSLKDWFNQRRLERSSIEEAASSELQGLY